MGRRSTIARLILGLLVVGVTAVLQTLILLVLLPSRAARIRSCVFFERTVGHACTWLSGCQLSVFGREHLDGRRPAIYVVNHTSIIDLFLVLKLVPTSAVGVAKKEIVRYPFFGQMYMLTGHLRLDRSNRESAVASLKVLVALVNAHKLSIALAPEGTRARDGCLQPFKKGLYHLARETGLPVVPIIIQGAHRIWRSDTISLERGQVTVTVHPAVDTAHWHLLDADGALDEIHGIYRRALPPEQLPRSAAGEEE